MTAHHTTRQVDRRITQLRDLLFELVGRDLKVRYKRSYLGILWSLLVPVTHMLVLFFVFRCLLPLDIPNYPSFLITGILPWYWFQTSLLAATTVVVDNKDLAQQPGFPLAVLPVIPIVFQAIHYLLALPVVFALLLLDGHEVTAAILALPLVLALQLAFTAALGYFTATAHVLFRDTQYLLGIALTLAFYLTPVFYRPDLVPEGYVWLLKINPMTGLLALYRSILLDGQLPGLRLCVVQSVGTAVLLGLGYLTFRQSSRRLFEDL